MAKYSSEIVNRIAELIASDSYTIVEVCNIVGIGKSTFYEWIETKTDFSDTIKKAEKERMEFFTVEAKKSLLKKLQGYTVQETHTVYTNPNGNGDASTIKEKKVIDKHFQPDTAAIIFTLTNGDPANWKNRQNTDLTTDGKSIFSLEVRDEETKKAVEELRRKL